MPGCSSGNLGTVLQLEMAHHCWAALGVMNATMMDICVCIGYSALYCPLCSGGHLGW